MGTIRTIDVDELRYHDRFEYKEDERCNKMYQLILLSLVALAASVPVSVEQKCPLCGIYCPNGYVEELDENGCNTCQCGTQRCPPSECPGLFCSTGKKKNDYGCEMCVCDGCQSNQECVIAYLRGSPLEGCNGKSCEVGSVGLPDEYYKKDASVEDPLANTDFKPSEEQIQKAEANRMAWYKANLPIQQYDEIIKSWE